MRLTGNGVLEAAAGATLYRLGAGFLIAVVLGVGIGIAMGRRQWVEDTLVPIVTFLYPIPGLAYAPLFVLWFGLGDTPTILLVGIISSCFTVIINTWKGVKAVKPIWLRSAEVMGADNREVFWRVVLPAALPYILIGLRLGLAQAWRILIAVEMLMSVQQGLGWLIFGAQTFLNTDVMLATIAVIGIIGILLLSGRCSPASSVTRWCAGAWWRHEYEALLDRACARRGRCCGRARHLASLCAQRHVLHGHDAAAGIDRRDHVADDR